MNKTRMLVLLAIGLLAGAALPAAAASAADPSPSAASAARPTAAVPVLGKTATPPVIDGVLDDPAWASGLEFDGFKTFKPDYGKDASQKTEAYIACDAENFYFAFRCYDSEPSKIKAAMSKRDAIFQDDIVFVVLDPFNDAQSGFSFIINPLGIQGDGMVDVNGNLQPSFDAVWHSKGRIDDRGWSVEARIPLKSIRFPGRDVLTMRVLFVRFFTRTSEQVSYPPMDPNYGSLTKRPGAETANADHALGLDYSFSNRKWVVDLGYQDISEDFQVDSGFVYRTGLRRLSAFSMYSIYPKSKFFQRIQPFYWSYHLYDTIDKMWETTNVFVLRFYLPRNTMVRFDGLLANEVYVGKRFDQSGYGFQAESQLAKSVYVETRVRRTNKTFSTR